MFLPLQAAAPRAETCLQNASHDLQARLKQTADEGEESSMKRVRGQGSIALGRLEKPDSHCTAQARLRSSPCTLLRSSVTSCQLNVSPGLPRAQLPADKPRSASSTMGQASRVNCFRNRHPSPSPSSSHPACRHAGTAQKTKPYSNAENRRLMPAARH